MNANAPSNSNTKKIGFWMVLSLVLGNMIGSGIFVTPSTLAPYGLASIWLDLYYFWSNNVSVFVLRVK